MIDHSAVTLFCLPFAGGSSHSYRELQRYADEHLRFVALDLPGRGKRFTEPLLYNLQDMVDDLFAQIRNRLDGAYAIYGHSLGACLGYLLVKRLIREKHPLPLHLFVSGREGPSVQGKEKNRHLLPRAAFFEVLERFEGTTREVLDHQELMDLFEPILRADFQVIATYVYEKSAPFDVPITVMRGDGESVTKAEALRWQEETTKKITLLEFPGGHFFIFRHAQEIVRMFSRTVRPSSGVAKWRRSTESGPLPSPLLTEI